MEKISTVLWDELLELGTKDAVSELSGFLSVLPAVLTEEVVRVDTRRLVVARRILKLSKALNEEPFGGKINAAGGSLDLDKEKGKAVFVLGRDFYERTQRRGRRKWAWLRGVWGGCGAMYLPQNGYHMVMRTHPVFSGGTDILAVLRSSGVEPKVRLIRGKTEYMIRDLESIVTCLTRMELVKTSLSLEDTAVIRSVRGVANKIVNCDSANIEKSLAAARAQMAIAEALDSYGLWDVLSPEMTELARARRANPSASLGELGQILSKPVSKSTVEYRWRKLETLISNLKK
ncbi:MAG: DNA-binding protein WhiA [Synergistaceae bacterium]|jgi:DNA-binding protein WhiA|nr:DNA-binding protein WhiA [Synergistaceae bacterium]